MAEAALTGLVVYPEQLFAEGHLVNRWGHSIMLTFGDHAKSEAPVNKRVNKGADSLPVGALRASIRAEMHRLGPTSQEGTVSVNVPYALYVLKGTGAIYSKTGRVPKGLPGAGQFTPIGFGLGGMYLPANPGYGKAKVVQRVRGQQANNFLERAGILTSALHPSLRGFNTV